jgi:rubrerythrin
MTDLKTPLCIECGSHEVRFDAEFGFYKCESCSTFWALDEDDPDYEQCPSCGNADAVKYAITCFDTSPDEPA